MGYKWVKVLAFVDEGEFPDQGLPPVQPGRPPYPDQGLPPYPGQGPIIPPGQPGRPDQGLPPYPGQGPIIPPPYPDQGLPGSPDYPSQGFPPGFPDQGLPTEPERQPKAYDIPDEPTDPPEGGAGEYVVVILNDEAVWAWVESSGDVEVEPPE
jgi:hypothetical protein